MAGRACEIPDESLEAVARVRDEHARMFQDNAEETEPVHRAAQGGSPQ